ncbi:MAG: YjfB family protein [bacterium]|nr:YjfB family protein [bacterium]
MDIASLSIAMSQSSLSSAISIGMLSKSLDQVEATGDAMTAMLEESVDPNVGQHIDIKL